MARRWKESEEIESHFNSLRSIEVADQVSEAEVEIPYIEPSEFSPHPLTVLPKLINDSVLE